jgi:hypothetical protein
MRTTSAPPFAVKYSANRWAFDPDPEAKTTNRFFIQ